MRGTLFAFLAMLTLVSALSGCSALRGEPTIDQPATARAAAPKSRFAKFRESVGKRFRMRPEAQTAFGGVQNQADDPTLALPNTTAVPTPMSSTASLGPTGEFQPLSQSAGGAAPLKPLGQSRGSNDLGETRGSYQLARQGLGLSPGLAGQTRGSASPYGNLRDTLASAGGYTRSAEGDGRVAPVQPLKAAYIPLKQGTRSADEAALLGPAADVIGDTRPVAAAPLPASPLAAEEQRLQAYINESRTVEALPQSREYYANLTAIGIQDPANMQPVVNGTPGFGGSTSGSVDLGGVSMSCKEFATSAEANAFFDAIGAGRPC